ncbi:MAG: hypothetical protein AAFQ57_12495 [Cyanobacteria bacterium J06626_14]
MNTSLLFALSTSMHDGLEAIAAVSVASLIFCPVFCWVLTYPNAILHIGADRAQSSLRNFDSVLRHSASEAANATEAV